MKNKSKSKSKLKNLILAAIFIYLGYTFIHQEIVMNKKKAVLANYSMELEKVEDENKNLLDQIKMSNTFRYVEKLARERLGFIKEGETVVVDEEQQNQ